MYEQTILKSLFIEDKISFFILLTFTCFTMGIVLRHNDYYEYSAMFTHQIPGRYHGDKVEILYMIDYENCLLECSIHERCDAINYDDEKETCELVHVKLGQYDKEIYVNKTEKGWIFIYTGSVDEYVDNGCDEFSENGDLAHEEGKQHGSTDTPCQCFESSTCHTVQGKVLNIAKDGKATMSSLFQEFYASSLTDGLFSFDKNDYNLLAHTKLDVSQWMQIELPRPAMIFMIRIINRVKEFEERLFPFTIYIGNTTNTLTPCMANIKEENPKVNVDVHVYCKQQLSIAKIIRIYKRENESIAIQEFEVFGKYNAV